MLRKTLTTIGAISLAFSLSACSAFSDDSTSTTAEGTLTVATSFYPITWLTEEIGGSHISVTSLTPPNVEPHEYELSPKEVTELEKTNVVIYASGFQPALDTAIEELTNLQVLNLSDSLDLLPLALDDSTDNAGHHEDADHDESEHNHGHEHGTNDPHFWLDPHYMIEAGTHISAMLEEKDPENAESYRANFDNLKSALETLNTELNDGLAQCSSRILISDHGAFGYIAHAYNLDAMPLSLDADSEPGPARLKELIEVIRDNGVTAIFAEEGTNSSATQSLSTETGAKVLEISTLERTPETGGYIDAMQKNVTILREGLGCE